ncbi:ZIP family metal transporter [Synechocystis salina]|uniref:hypothetical protein n=1 Tax=Synechocystis salina TaxID=945780 RepID=UPI001D139D14|nr:hypothetical protein [Synechocystis salina]
MTAFFQGILGASSMALGALIAVAWQPGRKFLAAVMAFGSGTLMAAIALEIASSVYRSANVVVLVGGFLFGGVLFISLSKYIDEHGAFYVNPPLVVAMWWNTKFLNPMSWWTTLPIVR